MGLPDCEACVRAARFREQRWPGQTQACAVRDGSAAGAAVAGLLVLAVEPLFKRSLQAFAAAIRPSADAIVV